MKTNPFKFGSIVDDPYFTDRTNEIERVKSIISSQNHLIIISPVTNQVEVTFLPDSSQRKNLLSTTSA